ncbi:MAG: methyltransferase [Pseudomonadota bacterium]
MPNSALDTLFYPFHQKMLNWPEEQHTGLFVPAEPCSELNVLSKSKFFLWRHSKIADDGIRKMDIPHPEGKLEKNTCDFAFCLPPKQKEEALYTLALAAQSLKPEGLLVAAASNDAGGKRLETYFEEMGIPVQCESKHKGRVVWGFNTHTKQDVIDRYLHGGDIREIELDGERYMTQPGLFSWDRIDAGSEMLVGCLPELKGIGADFGCGYGYLSRKVLQNNPDIETLFVIDEDYRALDMTAENVPGVIPIWHDLREPSGELPALDWIVMNPPFHAGKKLEPDLGKYFIRTAAASLKPGGMLYMVANAHLPYESIMQQYFREPKKLMEANGYKVYGDAR